jgi:hypothetical protein
MFGLVAALTLVSASGCSMISQQRELDPNVDAAFAKFYTQPIEWNSCDKFDCADVMVPMNWNDPEGEVITISVIRSEATGANPIGDLLLNPGGPGSSGVNFVRDNLEYIGTEALRENYNLIGFDPRGVDRSGGLRCLTDAELDASMYLDYTPDSPEEEDLLDAAPADFASPAFQSPSAIRSSSHPRTSPPPMGRAATRRSPTAFSRPSRRCERLIHKGRERPSPSRAPKTRPL